MRHTETERAVHRFNAAIVVGDGHATILWRFHYGPGKANHVREVTVFTAAEGVITEALGHSTTPAEQALPLPTE